MHLFCVPVFYSLLCLPGKSREEAQSKSKTGFSLLPYNWLLYVSSARTRRINNCNLSVTQDSILLDWAWTFSEGLVTDVVVRAR